MAIGLLNVKKLLEDGLVRIQREHDKIIGIDKDVQKGQAKSAEKEEDKKEDVEKKDDLIYIRHG
jgi:hypothetical protein